MRFVSKISDKELGDTVVSSEIVTTTYALAPECHFVTETYTDHLFTVVIKGVTHYLRGITREACLKEAYALAHAHHDNGQ
jgi:hypothetical protein